MFDKHNGYYKESKGTLLTRKVDYNFGYDKRKRGTILAGWSTFIYLYACMY